MTLAEFINDLGMGEVSAEINENGTTIIYFNNVGLDYTLEVDTAEEIYEAWKNFDVDEAIETWLQAKQGGVGGIPSVRQLVFEVETIERTIDELATLTCEFKGV